MNQVERIALPVTPTVLLVACASTATSPPAAWDGLQYRPMPGDAALYVRPGLVSGTYRAVMIDPLLIETATDEFPIGNSETGAVVGHYPVSRAETDYIENAISPVVREIVAKELLAGGYQVVEQPGNDTVRLTPGPANAYIDTRVQASRHLAGSVSRIYLPW